MREQKQQVLRYYLRAYEEQMMAGTSGNISVFDRASGLMAITPSGVSTIGMTAEDIMVIDLAGDIREGKHRPSSEWRLHAAIYRDLPQSTAVVHTHSPYATGFAVADLAIPLILIEMVPFLGGSVEVSRFALPGSDAVGDEAVSAMPDGRKACLMQNHGVVAWGENIEKAYVSAVYVEDAAKIYAHARVVGTPKPIPDDAAEEMYRRMGLR